MISGGVVGGYFFGVSPSRWKQCRCSGVGYVCNRKSARPAATYVVFAVSVPRSVGSVRRLCTGSSSPSSSGWAERYLPEQHPGDLRPDLQLPGGNPLSAGPARAQARRQAGDPADRVRVHRGVQFMLIEVAEAEHLTERGNRRSGLPPTRPIAEARGPGRPLDPPAPSASAAGHAAARGMAAHRPRPRRARGIARRRCRSFRPELHASTSWPTLPASRPSCAPSPCHGRSTTLLPTTRRVRRHSSRDDQARP